MWPHGSQCFDEGNRGNWADRWFHVPHGTWVSKFPGINIPILYSLYSFYTLCINVYSIFSYSFVFFACWSGGMGILKNCLCATVLCTIIMVHNDTSSSTISGFDLASFSSLSCERLYIFDVHGAI